LKIEKLLDIFTPGVSLFNYGNMGLSNLLGIYVPDKNPVSGKRNRN